MNLKQIPPASIVFACAQIWFYSYFYFIFQHYLIFSMYSTVIIVTAVVLGLHYITFEQIDDEISKQVLFKGLSNELPIFAHRGGAHDAPENTIVAIREAKKNGADGVELDLSFTKDNIAVLFHDDTIERTTNGFGNLARKTFVEIRELDAAANHIYKDRYKGEKVATLEEGIQECLKLNLKLILDVKEYDNRAVAIVHDMFSKYKELYEVALVASFYPSFIYQLRRVDPKIVTALTFRPHFVSLTDIPNGRPRYGLSWQNHLARLGDVVLEWCFHSWLWYITGVSAVLVHKDYLSAEYVRMWRSRNIEVIAWTPNHRLEKEYLRKVLNLRRVDPKIVTALTFRPHFVSLTDIPNGRPRYGLSWQNHLARLGDVVLEWCFHSWLWYITGVSAVLVHKDYLSAEYVRMWRSRNIEVIAWTPNHRLEKEYLRKVLNVSYISDTLL